MKLLIHTLTLLLGVMVMGIPTSGQAQATAQATEDCSKELLLSYFPESFVRSTLKKFNVPENEWSEIISELKSQDKEVIKTVESKASAMNPNPLKDPSDRQAAVKLFRETLLGVFAAVLKKHGIQDQKKIQSMLDDIQQQKAQKFAACMKKSAPSNQDEDEDEDDYDDEDDDEDDEKSTNKTPAASANGVKPSNGKK